MEKHHLSGKMQIQQFRKAVYQSISKRADSILDLVDALTVAGHVDSPVALSEETPFQRKFSSVYDALQHGEFDFDLLQQALLTFQPDDSEQIAGYDMLWIARPMSVRKPEHWKTEAHSKHRRMNQYVTDTSTPGWCGWFNVAHPGQRLWMCGE